MPNAKRFADTPRDPDPECNLLSREMYERIGKHVVFWAGSLDGEAARRACEDRPWMRDDEKFKAWLDEIAAFDYLTVVVPKGTRLWSPLLKAIVFTEIVGRPLVDETGKDMQTPEEW